MALETTLVLVKPDGVQRGLVGEIVSRFEQKGLQLVGLKLLKAPRALLEKHYAVHRERPFYAGLLAFMSSGPVVAMALRGHGAIETVRTLMGSTNAAAAPAGTIRGDHGMSRSFNLVHGSDGSETARSELALWFPGSELLDYDLDALRWVYDPEDRA
jgi:nucleoside-diphosphate kinase